VIERAEATSEGFQILTSELDRLLAEINGEEHEFFDSHNRVDLQARVVLAKVDGEHAGCGAFRACGDKAIEIKRMFVRPAYRGKGLAQAILLELESWARELGYEQAILETSKQLISAVSLYRRSGYAVIPNYAPYEAVMTSVCMAKDL
jgi:putative acetyltransferase